MYNAHKLSASSEIPAPNDIIFNRMQQIFALRIYNLFVKFKIVLFYSLIFQNKKCFRFHLKQVFLPLKINLMFRKISAFLIFISLFSCQQQTRNFKAKAEGTSIKISDSISQNDSITAFIEPFKKHIDQEMNNVLSYSKFNLDKTEGNYNTAIGNMMADAVMELASPVFESRTGNKIDAILLNHGGIRSTINQGNITTRTAYQVMPFENEVVVAELNAAQMQKLFDYLKSARTAHPISGMKLVLNVDGEIGEALIQDEPLDKNRSYFIATNDYLLNGGDNMNFFQNRKSETFLDYKIRNLLIDYFTKKDTIAPVRDQRFTILAE